jgi:hypothetical protein
MNPTDQWFPEWSVQPPEGRWDYLGQGGARRHGAAGGAEVRPLRARCSLIYD